MEDERAAHVSRWVEAVSRAWDDAHPEIAVESAVRHFKRMPVRTPASLVPAGDAPRWQGRQLNEAADLYRDIFTAGAAGLLLRDLTGGQRRRAALKALRGAAGAVAESKETRRDKAGALRPLIVLRSAGDRAPKPGLGSP